MYKDIIYNENELTIAANNIISYTDYIVRCIEELNQIIIDLSKNGIQDELITEKLKVLNEQLTPYKKNMNEYGNNVSQSVKKSISEIAAADNFQFPEIERGMIASLLSHFI